jgi:hypothetical protein
MQSNRQIQAEENCKTKTGKRPKRYETREPLSTAPSRMTSVPVESRMGAVAWARQQVSTQPYRAKRVEHPYPQAVADMMDLCRDNGSKITAVANQPTRA